MVKPILSVVMPVHNGGAWLEAALESLAPAGEAIEVIIRDSSPDGPSDAAVARHAHRLVVDYRWVPDIDGWTRKTNTGVSAAKAEHACILHQDDLWLPERLPRFLDNLTRDPAAALYLSPSWIVDANGRRLGRWRIPLPAGSVDQQKALTALLIQNNVAMPAPIFRRDAYQAVGGLDESLWYTPDWDLWLKLAAHGPVFYDPRPSTAFRIHGNSLTLSGNRAEFASQLKDVLSRHLPPSSPDAEVCHTSVRVNILLAQAIAGRPAAAVEALARVIMLGPRRAARYLHASRLAERVLPRLRSRFAGVW